jgi:MtrB/PioB family decaheme-associated outer membrane protein
MKPETARLLPVLGLALTGTLSADALAADAPDTSDWKCEQCPFYSGYEGEAEAGAFGASGANASYGRYTGVDSNHVYADLSAKGARQTTEGNYLNYDLEALGLPSRSALLQVGHDGQYSLALGYDGQPVRMYDSTVTPYLGSGGGSLTLPGNWVPAVTTGGMTALNSSLNPVKIEWDRRTVALTGKYYLGSNWSFYGELSRQEKDGTGLIGGSFLTQAVELPQPLDYVTTNFEAGARWSGSNMTFRIAYSGSWFRNSTDTLTFANPYTPIVPGSTSGQLAQPPGNDLQQVTASGDAHLPWWASTLSFVISLGRLRQDEAFLPVSTLPGTPALAQGSLDGDVHLSHYGLSLSSRPLARLYLRGTATYDGRDDDTAVLTVPYIVTDTFPGGNATAVRYSEDRTRLDGSADYAVENWMRLGVAGTFTSTHYSPGQPVTWTQDGIGWARAIVTPRVGLTFTLKGGGDTRKASPYDTSVLPITENPLVQNFNYAARDRTFYSLTSSWQIGSKWTWSLEGFSAHDRYPFSQLGLQSEEERRVDTTFTYVPREHLSVYVEAGYQRLYALQDGFTGAATPPWQVHNTQRYWNVSAGVQSQLSERWDLAVDYLHAPAYDSTETLIGGLPQAFPDNTSTLDWVRLDLRYRWTTPLSLHLRYEFEKLDSSDWAMNGVGPATVPNLLSVGRAPFNHNVNLFGLSVQYRFGTTSAAPATSE